MTALPPEQTAQPASVGPKTRSGAEGVKDDGKEREDDEGRWRPTFLKESWTKNFCEMPADADIPFVKVSYKRSPTLKIAAQRDFEGEEERRSGRIPGALARPEELSADRDDKGSDSQFAKTGGILLRSDIAGSSLAFAALVCACRHARLGLKIAAQ